MTEEEEVMAGAEAGVKGVEEKEAMVEAEEKEERDLVVAAKGEGGAGGAEEEEAGEGDLGEGKVLVGEGEGCKAHFRPHELRMVLSCALSGKSRRFQPALNITTDDEQGICRSIPFFSPWGWRRWRGWAGRRRKWGRRRAGKWWRR